jgi:phosphotriesterase-related protein
MMAQVHTILGPVDASKLGRTLMHEHVFVLSPEIEKWPAGQGVDPSEEWDEPAQVARAIEKLRDLKRHGIDTVVDLSVIGLGRNTRLLLQVARAVPEINLVIATGLYTYDVLPFFFRFRGPDTLTGGPELMTEMWVRDIERGIANTGARPAILKCATDLEGLTPGVERVIRSVARAHRRTGIPINTHTPIPPEPWGLEQQRVLREEGVDLRHVVIGHGGGTRNLDYLQQLMDAGSVIGMDRFGLNTFSFDETVGTVAELCRRGYADRMVLSHDASCYSDWFPARMLDALPNWHWNHIARDVLPALRKAGVSEAQIDQMLVENPRRILTPCKPY